MSADTCLNARDISLARDQTTLLSGVDISVQHGQVLGLLGPNGAGKTTLLSVLAGIQAADRGAVEFDGQNLASLDPQARARRIAYLPQNAPVHWPLTVQSVVALGRLPHRRGAGNSAAVDVAAVEQALSHTAMTPYRDRTLSTLSGGERMRALVARMLAVQADILLADEPVSGLDPYFQLEFMDLFVSQAREGRGVVLVLHDLALAARYCDVVVLLDQGRVVGEGVPSAVLSEAHLRSVYRIEALQGDHNGNAFVLPWQRTQ